MDPVVSRAIAGYAQVASPTASRSGMEPQAQQGQDFASFFREYPSQKNPCDINTKENFDFACHPYFAR